MEIWEDPFAEPLSDENRALVEKTGKWIAFDVSAGTGTGTVYLIVFRLFNGNGLLHREAAGRSQTIP